VVPVPAPVPCRVTTRGPHQPCTPCLRNLTTCACEIARVGYDTICNDPPPRGQAHLRLVALYDHKNFPIDQHMSFLCTLSSLMCTREGLPSRSPIAPSQARLSLVFLVMLCDQSGPTPAIHTMPAQVRPHAPVKPRESALIPFVTTCLPEASPAYAWQLSNEDHAWFEDWWMSLPTVMSD
jgi:hypothetical protein